MQVHVYSGSLTRLSSELLVVSCFEDLRPLRGLSAEVDWIYGGALSRVLMQGRFSGHPGEALLFATEGKLKIPKVLLLGQGSARSAHLKSFQRMSAALHRILSGLCVAECALEVHPGPSQKIDTLSLVDRLLEDWPPPEDLSRPLELKLLVEEREKASVLQKVRSWIPQWRRRRDDERKEGLQFVQGAL